MVLVNKIRVLQVVFIFLVITFFSACAVSSKNINKDKEYTKKIYKNVNKDAILEASKKIFMYSGNRSFIIDSYRDSIYVIKPRLVVRFFQAYTIEDKWSVSVEEKDKTTIVKLNIKRIEDYDEKNPIYFKKPLYEFFWKRLDFMLGLNKNWPECNDNTFADYALCDPEIWDKVTPNKYDVLKNITFDDKIKVRNIEEYGEDILSKDIELSVDEDKTDDILLNDNQADLNEDTKDKENLDVIDKEIDKLNKEVNENIDQTLDQIKVIEQTSNK